MMRDHLGRRDRGAPERHQRDGRGAARRPRQADLRDPVVERRRRALSLASRPAPAEDLRSPRERRRCSGTGRGRGAAEHGPAAALRWAFRGIVGLRRRAVSRRASWRAHRLAGAGDRGRQPDRRRRRQDADRDRHRRRCCAATAARPASSRAATAGDDDGGARGRAPTATRAAVGDEPLLLRRRTGVPVFVGSDRVAAGHALLRRHPAGRRHRQRRRPAAPARSARDVEVLVFDERGAGNGRLLPAGPLREPLPAAAAGERSSCSTTPARRRRRCPASSAGARWPASSRSPTGGAARRRAPAALEALRGRALVAAAGLARPERFFAMLRDARPRRRSTLPLPDHHDFATLPWPVDDRRRRRHREGRGQARPGAAHRLTRVWVATLDFEPEPAFDAALLALLPARRIACHRRSAWKPACSNCSSARSARGRCSTGARRCSERQELVCKADRLAFPVRDGIPVMLEGEARGRCDRRRLTHAARRPRLALRRPDPGAARLDAAAGQAARRHRRPADDRARRAARRAVGARARSSVAADDATIVAACAAHGVAAVLTRHAPRQRQRPARRSVRGCSASPATTIVVNVQGDEPLIDPALIDACADLLERRSRLRDEHRRAPDRRAPPTSPTRTSSRWCSTPRGRGALLLARADPVAARSRRRRRSGSAEPRRRCATSASTPTAPASCGAFRRSRASPLERSRRSSSCACSGTASASRSTSAHGAPGIGVDTPETWSAARALFAANAGAGFA